MINEKEIKEIKTTIMPLLEEEKSLRDQLKNLLHNDGEKNRDEIIEITDKINKCQESIFNLREKMTIDMENKRFKKIESSQQAIIADAHDQTNAIINYMLIAIRLWEPESKEEEKNDVFEQIKPLLRIWDEQTIKNIHDSEGEAAKLDTQQIIKLIHGQLHRHLSRLNEQNRKDLEDYIKSTVADAVNKHPEIENGNYWIVTKDSIFQTILPLAVQRRKPQTRKGKSYFRIGTVKYSFEEHSYKDLIKHLGINAVRLYWMINHKFTQKPNAENQVSFSTIPFFELCGKGDAIKNPKTFSTEIERFRYGELRSLLSMVVSLDKKDKEGLPELYDQTLFENTFINKERIIVTLSPKFADYLRFIGTKGYIPQELLLGDGRQTNAFAIKSKLWDNATQYNNLLSGQGKIISVKSLLKETSLPTIEDLGTYKSRWRERIRNKFETALSEAFNSSLFTEWEYCKSKSQPLTPQERRDADRDYYSWVELFISYDIKDQAFKASLIEDAEKNKEKKIEASEKRRRKEVIETAKALEKLEKN